MHICVSKLTVIGSDNGLSPGLNHPRILSIGSLRINLNEILIEIYIFSLKSRSQCINEIILGILYIQLVKNLSRKITLLSNFELLCAGSCQGWGWVWGGLTFTLDLPM